MNVATTTTGQQSYLYDGHGRRARTLNVSTGTIEYYGYGKDGRLLQDWSNRRQVRNGYVYLGNTMVGLYEVNLSNGTVTPKYQHTDALGSPVATTNAGKTVLSRMSYTPYGLPTLPMGGVGYTGHFMDVGTQLTYMQQRYYDPAIGKMLNTDPVGALDNSLLHFNRYAYAYNNPYRFSDPDGRCPSCIGAAFGGLISLGVEGYKQYRSGDFKPKDLLIEGGKGELSGALLGGVGGKLLGLAVEGSISAEAAAGGMAATGFAVGAGTDSAGRAAKGESQSASGSMVAGVATALVAPLAMAAEPAVAAATSTAAVPRTGGNLVISNRGLAQSGVWATSSTPATAEVQRPIVTGAILGAGGSAAEGAVNKPLKSLDQ
jgi:RHS repeat-associated protein